MFPYLLHVVWKLEDHDITACKDSAQWCLQNIQMQASFLNCIIYSDEFVFREGGRINQHNVRTLVTENPHEQREIGRDCEKVAVWCAMSVN